MLRLIPRECRGWTHHTTDPRRASYDVQAGDCGRYNILPMTALGVLWAIDVVLGIPLCACHDIDVQPRPELGYCFVGPEPYVTCDWVGYVV